MDEEKEKSLKEVDNAREITNLKKVEATLFISAKWTSIQDLVMLTDFNPIILQQLLEKLAEKYSIDNTCIEILNKNDMWKMDVKEEHSDIVNKMATGSAEFTKAEQETLAVIAYKQPMKQSVLINIRGNKAYDHVKNFVNLGLLRAKKMGRTKELSLSDDFYNYFHVQNPEKKISEENKLPNKPSEVLDVEPMEKK